MAGAAAARDYYQGLDPDIKALIQVLIEGQIRTEKSVAELALTVDRYVAAADARMARIEESLDGVTKGKGHP